MSRRFIVIDNNVLISAVLSSKGTAYQAFAKVIQTCSLVQTIETYQEIKSRIYKPKFDKYISDERRQQFLKVVKDKSQFIQTILKITICRDTDDNKFLELAIDAKAKFLITGDKDLLSLKSIEEYKYLIITPREFIEIN